MSLGRPDRRALLIDFDGTIADTLAHLRRVYAQFVTERGGAPSDEEFESFNGPPIAEVVRDLCQKLGLSAVDEQLAYYNGLIDGGFESIAVAEGAHELFATAEALGLERWIVTSNARDRVVRWLHAHALEQHCGVIVSGDDRVPGKPSPAPYLRALEKLDLVPDQAIAIEDSVSGARSALAAGLATIKLGPPLPEPLSQLHQVADLREAAALLQREP